MSIFNVPILIVQLMHGSAVTVHKWDNSYKVIAICLNKINKSSYIK